MSCFDRHKQTFFEIKLLYLIAELIDFVLIGQPMADEKGQSNGKHEDRMNEQNDDASTYVIGSRPGYGVGLVVNAVDSPTSI